MHTRGKTVAGGEFRVAFLSHSVNEAEASEAGSVVGAITVYSVLEVLTL